MHEVRIGGQCVQAQEGELLSVLLRTLGYPVEQPCGGLGSCGKCTVLVNGQKELACQYRITGDIQVELPQTGEILSETGVQERGGTGGETCLVLDLGTTTLALALVDVYSRSIRKVLTRTNPQRMFGADVMTRIERCSRCGAAEQQRVVRGQIREMLAQTGAESGKALYVAGNTTMLHLLFGVDCTSMGVAPYRPVFLEQQRIDGRSLGLEYVREVVSLPGIAAFVGADVVAGMYYTGFPPEGKYNLLVDLGTNAEVALYTRGKVLCAAAAAGPCFEGANISCGMSAMEGAIYAFDTPDRYETVGKAAARGICGTGLVDLIAVLLDAGVIDETGFMEDDWEITEEVRLTQADVRQFQLAKSAVCSAICTLMQMEGVTAEEIHRLYISGGFSARIRVSNAVKTGLLPETLQDRCEPIRNSSLLGLAKFAAEQGDLVSYIASARYVDLSANSTFSDLFVENMLFSQE